MKNFVTLILIICLQFENSFSAKASHMVGSDISYTCTSTPGVWKVTLILYRDCQGIPICSGGCGATCTKTMSIAGADPTCNGTNFGSFTVSLVSVSDVNINPQCNNAKSICDNMGCVTPGSYLPGIERYQFEGNVDLSNGSGIPAGCCNVRLFWSECCRNGAITTLIPNNFYIEAVINRCLSQNPCNSSPQLSNDPFAVLCGGQAFVFNNGAIDLDHDSLTYAFAPALEGPGASASYRDPYSAQTPMPWTGPASAPFPAGISCNAVTGDVMFIPAYGAGGQFIGVVAYEIKQWRTIGGIPTVIGTTRRDIQMWLISCPPNNPPRIMTNPSLGNQPKLTWETCVGSTICFDVIAKDTDFYPFINPPISDTTYLLWNSALASKGATFLPKYNLSQRKINGPREDTYQFCWTPDETMASDLPWYFTVAAKDSRCPNPGKASRAISIKVLPKADVTIVKNYVGCGQWKVSYTKNKPSQQFVSTVWNISNTPNDYSGNNVNTYLNTVTAPVQSFPAPGKYLVELMVNTPGPYGTGTCAYSFYDTLNVQQVSYGLYANVTDTAICNSSSVLLNFNAGAGHPPYTYHFFISPDTINPINSNFSTSNFFLTGINKTNKYILQVIDSAGCRSFDWDVWIYTKPPLPVITGPASVISGNEYTYSVTRNEGSAYQWLSGNGGISSGQGTNMINRYFTVAGNDYLKVIEYSNTCVSDTATKLIEVTNVGIKNVSSFHHLNIYPNPANTELNIELGDVHEETTIELIDILGKTIMQKSFHPKHHFTEKLDVSELARGVYFINIKVGEQQTQSKVVLK